MLRLQPAALLSLISLWLLPAAAAQPWQGPAAVGLEANSRKGRPVTGARVTLIYKDVVPEAGPGPVQTDSRGRAVFTGLAEGTWQLEVAHPDFLTYVADLLVRRGKKPAVLASFLEAGGGSLEPVRVKWFQAQGQAPSAPVGPPTQVPPEAPIERRVAQQAPSEPSVQEPPTAPAPAAEETEQLAGQAIATPAPPGPEAPAAEEGRIEDLKPPPTAAAPAAEAPQPQARVAEAASPLGSLPPTAATGETEPPAEMPALESPEEPARPARSLPQLVEPVPDRGPAEPSQAPAPAIPIVDEVAAEASPLQAVDEVEPEPAGPPPAEEPPSLPVPSPQPEEAPLELAQEEPGMPPPAPVPEPELEPQAATEPTEERALKEATSVPAAPTVEAPAAVTESLDPAAPPLPQPAEEAEEPAPSPPAPAPLPAPGRTQAVFRSMDGGSCPECEEGGWAISSEVVAGPAAAAGACTLALREATARAMEIVGQSIQLELRSFGGPVADGSPGDALEFLSAAEREQVVALLEPLQQAEPGCAVVGVVLPKWSRVRGASIAAFDGRGGGPCRPGEECAIGGCEWVVAVEALRGASSTVYWGLFENRAPDRQRRARLTVRFAPSRPDWSPPAPR